MRAKLIRIGNSRRVRLPKAVIEQAGLEDDIEITVEGRQVVLGPPRNPREGWEEAIRKSIDEEGEDIDNEFLNFPNESSEELKW